MSKTGIPPTTALADSLDHPSVVTENVPAVLKENALFKSCKQKNVRGTNTRSNQTGISESIK